MVLLSAKQKLQWTDTEGNVGKICGFVESCKYLVSRVLYILYQLVAHFLISEIVKDKMSNFVMAALYQIVTVTGGTVNGNIHFSDNLKIGKQPPLLLLLWQCIYLITYSHRVLKCCLKCRRCPPLTKHFIWNIQNILYMFFQRLFFQPCWDYTDSNFKHYFRWFQWSLSLQLGKGFWFHVWLEWQLAHSQLSEEKLWLIPAFHLIIDSNIVSACQLQKNLIHAVIPCWHICPLNTLKPWQSIKQITASTRLNFLLNRLD